MRWELGMAVSLAFAFAQPTFADEEIIPRVVMETDAGILEIELYIDRAPLSAGRFLAYVDNGLYADGGTFYRAVRQDNDNGTPVIEVVQGGISDSSKALPRIAHESTRHTGLRHLNGVISLARDSSPETDGGNFFICIGDQPALDHGGQRNPDGLGFSAFGKVAKGMDAVRSIHRMSSGAESPSPYTKGQMLDKPVRILKVYRKAPEEGAVP